MNLKSKQIFAYLAKNPTATTAEGAAKFGVSRPYIHQMRKKLQAMQAKSGEQWAVILEQSTGDVVASKDGQEVSRVKTALSKDAVDTVLDTRAVQYGTFKEGAALMQSLKRTLADHAQRHNRTFADDQWEALEMIVHKIARIVNGNPDNHDSWVDIAGYAMLVADRLEGNAR